MPILKSAKITNIMWEKKLSFSVFYRNRVYIVKKDKYFNFLCKYIEFFSEQINTW